MEVSRHKIWLKTEGKCWYCGCDIIEDHLKRNSFEIEHIDPRGGNKWSNLVPSRRYCNTIKSKYSLEKFRERYVERVILRIPNFNDEQKKWLFNQGIDVIGLVKTKALRHLFYFEKTKAEH